MIYDLPRAVEFGGREWAINTDYRDVLNILEAFEDPNLTDEEKAFVCLYCLYEDFGEIPREDAAAAYEAAIGFIDHGSGEQQSCHCACAQARPARANPSDSSVALPPTRNTLRGRRCVNRQDGPRSMDWAQDAPLIFPAVNRAAGFEVRSVEYMHWWTFVGLFMEIRESVFSTVLNLRQKKNRGKKLEKHEKEFWDENKGICVLKARLTDEEKAEKDALEKLLG